jgi:mannose-1-phosphate guanylyltransferase
MPAFALLPADHVIEDGAGFRSVLTSSFVTAEKNEFLVTIGIKPTFPSTGYGYLCRGAEMEKASGRLVSKVDRFVEKPDLGNRGKISGRGWLFLECRYVCVEAFGYFIGYCQACTQVVFRFG